MISIKIIKCYYIFYDISYKLNIISQKIMTKIVSVCLKIQTNGIF